MGEYEIRKSPLLSTSGPSHGFRQPANYRQSQFTVQSCLLADSFCFSSVNYNQDQ